ncbi:hypothetical protein [Furfurilactobacillus curtus]|uniref:hypothetical protein n=1 Tax=Furfurilactobacillus curtus TaxID=1746200 RepID=UPI0038B36BE6
MDQNQIITISGIPTGLTANSLKEIIPFNQFPSAEDLASANENSFNELITNFLATSLDYPFSFEQILAGVKLIISLGGTQLFAVDKHEDYVIFWPYLLGHFTVTHHFDEGFYFAMIKQNRQVLIPISPMAIRLENGLLIRDQDQLDREVKERYMLGFNLYAIGLVRFEEFQILNQLSYAP